MVPNTLFGSGRNQFIQKKKQKKNNAHYICIQSIEQFKLIH